MDKAKADVRRYNKKCTYASKARKYYKKKIDLSICNKKSQKEQLSAILVMSYEYPLAHRLYLLA